MRIECLRALHARIEGLLFSLTQEVQSQPLQNQLEHRPRLSSATERQLLTFGLDDDFIDWLTDKIAGRLKSRGVQ
jgi:hypothetical protein